jgi:hypothetical protein
MQVRGLRFNKNNPGHAKTSLGAGFYVLLIKKKPSGRALPPGTDSTKALLFLSAIDKDQRDTRDERKPADNGRQRDVFFRIGRDLEGTDIKDFLLGRILDTLIDQSQDSQNDENNA